MLKKIWIYFGGDKLQTLRDMIKFHGGMKNLLYQSWR